MPLGASWAGPGKPADKARWNFDLKKSRWIEPGQTPDLSGTQANMPALWNPQQRGQGVSLLASPPGQPAPPNLLNYTPDLGALHPPGEQAPVQRTNLSLVPSGKGGLPGAASGSPSLSARASTPSPAAQTAPVAPLEPDMTVLEQTRGLQQALLGAASGAGRSVGVGAESAQPASERLSQEQIEALIRAYAPADLAHDPRFVRAVTAIAKAESGWDTEQSGDAGASIGLFQMHSGGAGAGMTVAERQDPARQMATMIPQFATQYRQMNPDRMSDEELAVWLGGAVERPAGWGEPGYASGVAANNYRRGVQALSPATIRPEDVQYTSSRAATGAPAQMADPEEIARRAAQATAPGSVPAATGLAPSTPAPSDPNRDRYYQDQPAAAAQPAAQPPLRAREVRAPDGSLIGYMGPDGIVHPVPRPATGTTPEERQERAAERTAQTEEGRRSREFQAAEARRAAAERSAQSAREHEAQRQLTTEAKTELIYDQDGNPHWMNPVTRETTPAEGVPTRAPTPPKEELVTRNGVTLRRTPTGYVKAEDIPTERPAPHVSSSTRGTAVYQPPGPGEEGTGSLTYLERIPQPFSLSAGEQRYETDPATGQTKLVASRPREPRYQPFGNTLYRETDSGLEAALSKPYDPVHFAGARGSQYEYTPGSDQPPRKLLGEQKQPVDRPRGGVAIWNPEDNTTQDLFPSEPDVRAGLRGGIYGVDPTAGTYRTIKPDEPEPYRELGGGIIIPAGRRLWFGAGQDTPQSPNAWQPPVNPQDVVGTGHKFGEPVDQEGIHKGVDLQAIEGTPVTSPVDGVVVDVKNDPKGLGLQVIIKDSKGEEHALGHLLSASVQKGDRVKIGQPVAQVGSSGNSTGPHLDIRERTPDGGYVDPTAKLGMLAQMPRADGAPDVGAGQGWPPMMGGYGGYGGMGGGWPSAPNSYRMGGGFGVPNLPPMMPPQQQWQPPGQPGPMPNLPPPPPPNYNSPFMPDANTLGQIGQTGQMLGQAQQQSANPSWLSNKTPQNFQLKPQQPWTPPQTSTPQRNTNPLAPLPWLPKVGGGQDVGAGQGPSPAGGFEMGLGLPGADIGYGSYGQMGDPYNQWDMGVSDPYTENTGEWFGTNNFFQQPDYSQHTGNWFDTNQFFPQQQNQLQFPDLTQQMQTLQRQQQNQRPPQGYQPQMQYGQQQPGQQQGSVDRWSWTPAQQYEAQLAQQRLQLQQQGLGVNAQQNSYQNQQQAQALQQRIQQSNQDFQARMAQLQQQWATHQDDQRYNEERLALEQQHQQEQNQLQREQMGLQNQQFGVTAQQRQQEIDNSFQERMGQLQQQESQFGRTLALDQQKLQLQNEWERARQQIQQQELTERTSEFGQNIGLERERLAEQQRQFGGQLGLQYGRLGEQRAEFGGQLGMQQQQLGEQATEARQRDILQRQMAGLQSGNQAADRQLGLYQSALRNPWLQQTTGLAPQWAAPGGPGAAGAAAAQGRVVGGGQDRAWRPRVGAGQEDITPQRGTWYDWDRSWEQGESMRGDRSRTSETFSARPRELAPQNTELYRPTLPPASDAPLGSTMREQLTEMPYRRGSSLSIQPAPAQIPVQPGWFRNGPEPFGRGPQGSGIGAVTGGMGLVPPELQDLFNQWMQERFGSGTVYAPGFQDAPAYGPSGPHGPMEMQDVGGGQDRRVGAGQGANDSFGQGWGQGGNIYAPSGGHGAMNPFDTGGETYGVSGGGANTPQMSNPDPNFGQNFDYSSPILGGYESGLQSALGGGWGQGFDYSGGNWGISGSGWNPAPLMNAPPTPAMPSWQSYQNYDPFQQAGLRTQTEMSGMPWEQYSQNMRSSWAAQPTGAADATVMAGMTPQQTQQFWRNPTGPTQAPNVTQLGWAQMDPMQRMAQGNQVQTFGQDPQMYMQQQQKRWRPAGASQVQTTV